MGNKISQLSRRNFLKASFLGAGALGLYAIAETHGMNHTVYDLPTRKWPGGYKPLRIAMVADLHVGCPSVPLERVENIVTKLNNMKADIILLLGDYLISAPHQGVYVPPGPIAERLGKLEAEHGVFAVLGNHDWHKDGPGMWRALSSNGIHVLENDAVRIDRGGRNFWLAGLADDTTRRPDVRGTFSKVSGADPVIAICHDPGTFLDIGEQPVVTLCGHTHGGQVRMPFYGALHIPSRAPRHYSYGHIREPNRDLIVTSGVGTSFLPIRVNCPPEVVSLTIRNG